MTFGGTTPLAASMHSKVVQGVVMPAAARGALAKPVLVISITDGEPTDTPKDAILQAGLGRARRTQGPAAMHARADRPGTGQAACLLGRSRAPRKARGLVQQPPAARFGGAASPTPQTCLQQGRGPQARTPPPLTDRGRRSSVTRAPGWRSSTARARSRSSSRRVGARRGAPPPLPARASAKCARAQAPSGKLARNLTPKSPSIAPPRSRPRRARPGLPVKAGPGPGRG